VTACNSSLLPLIARTLLPPTGSIACGWQGQVGPRRCAINARIRVRRVSAASAERCCSAASAATAAPRRLPKRDRITSAASALTPRVKSAGPSPAARAISRQRHISVMSVSFDRTVVARLFSTRALTSSGKGSSQWRVVPFRRRSSSVMVMGGRASVSCNPGTSVVKRSSPTWTFSRARLVYAGTRTSMNASGRGELSLSFILTGRLIHKPRSSC
jgi:hypothetical protein